MNLEVYQGIITGLKNKGIAYDIHPDLLNVLCKAFGYTPAGFTLEDIPTLVNLIHWRLTQ